MAKDTETSGVASGPPPFPGTASPATAPGAPSTSGAGIRVTFDEQTAGDAAVAVNAADLKQLVDAAAAAGVDQAVLDKFAGI